MRRFEIITPEQLHAARGADARHDRLRRAGAADLLDNGADPAHTLTLDNRRSIPRTFFKGLTTARFRRSGRKKSRATARISLGVTSAILLLTSSGETTFP